MNEPLFFITTQSQTERGGLISSLRKKGYQLLVTDATQRHVDDRFPQKDWPFLTVDTLKGVIDLRMMPPTDTYSMAVSVADIKELPKAPKTTATQPNIAVQSLVLPEAAKYRITYKKEDGKIVKYDISNPVSANQQTITCYCFGKGVRCFQRKRVMSIQKVT